MSLVNIRGPEAGNHYSIGDGHLVSVGRDEQCNIQIRHARVSRQHLQITVIPGVEGHSVADYRTANGTTLNGVKVTERAPLRDGDELGIGDTTLVYTIDDYPDAETAIKAARKKGEWKRSTIM
ncbi:MAG: FHA domain-containing protein [Phycisphaeraceae bacterium]|nr:FHA domain-containing protein [Phycisphaeraceae bacterium]